jgi:aminoglycoside N3'-acetyltransferase
MFRTGTGVVRSIQATHSLAARGPLAGDMTSGHYHTDTPCGGGTPYRRFVDRHASVLMFGVTFHSYTLFHTAEDASGSEYAYEAGTRDRLRVIDGRGEHRECLTRRQTRNARRFKEAGDLLEQEGLVRRCELGRGALLFVPDCALVHEFLVDRLRRVPDFLYQSCQARLA